MLTCVKCGTPLMEIPVYNNAQDEEYAPSIPFCPDEKCSRGGLLTVIFKNEKKDKKDGDEKVQS